MNRMMAVLALFASLLFSQFSNAGSLSSPRVPMDFEGVVRTMTGSVNIPIDWDGLWMTVDSVYICGGGLQNVSSELDTICGGQVFSEEPPNSQFTFTCKGTATGTTINGTCTGGGEAFPDCQVSVVVDFQSTRTGESYRSVTTVNTTYAGTGKGCDLIQDSCTRVVSEGTRTGPAPPAFCSTPAKRTSWGKLKAIYR